jgi:hypothetical protein
MFWFLAVIYDEYTSHQKDYLAGFSVGGGGVGAAVALPHGLTPAAGTGGYIGETSGPITGQGELPKKAGLLFK